MDLINGFLPANNFYDDANFPRGFKRTGDFTIAEADLLTNVGSRLFALEQAISKPENQVEENFVNMCQMNHEGKTEIEKLWQKYKRLTVRRPFYSLNGVRRVIKTEETENDEFETEDDEFETENED